MSFRIASSRKESNGASELSALPETIMALMTQSELIAHNDIWQRRSASLLLIITALLLITGHWRWATLTLSNLSLAYAWSQRVEIDHYIAGCIHRHGPEILVKYGIRLVLLLLVLLLVGYVWIGYFMVIYATVRILLNIADLAPLSLRDWKVSQAEYVAHIAEEKQVSWTLFQKQHDASFVEMTDNGHDGSLMGGLNREGSFPKPVSSPEDTLCKRCSSRPSSGFGMKPEPSKPMESSPTPPCPLTCTRRATECQRLREEYELVKDTDVNRVVELANDLRVAKNAAEFFQDRAGSLQTKLHDSERREAREKATVRSQRSELLALRERLAEKEEKVDSLEKTAKNGNMPALIRARLDLKAAQNMIENLQQELKTCQLSLTQRLNESLAAARVEANAAEEERQKCQDTRMMEPEDPGRQPHALSNGTESIRQEPAESQEPGSTRETYRSRN